MNFIKNIENNVIIGLSKQLVDKYSSIDEPIINLFIRTQRFARIKAINKRIRLLIFLLINILIKRRQNSAPPQILKIKRRK